MSERTTQWLILGVGVIAGVNLYITYRMATALQSVEGQVENAVGNINTVTNPLAGLFGAIFGRSS